MENIKNFVKTLRICLTFEPGKTDNKLVYIVNDDSSG